jgi:predicted dehydrogenase
MQSVNVALVGFGRAGRVFHAPLLSHIEGLRLAAIVSSRPDDVRKAYPEARAYAKPEDAFDDPAIELVVIATPNDLHFPLAAAALAAGKHVVIDKPFAATVDETEKLIAIAEQAGRIVSVFQNRRWDADFLTLKRVIAEGLLGDVTVFESRIDRYRVPTGGWREKRGPSNGLWYDIGAHTGDQALTLFGPPLAVMADFAVQREGVEMPDYFLVQLRYERLRVVLSGNFLAAENDRRFLVHGTRASFVKSGADPQEAALTAGQIPGPGWGEDPRPGHLRLADGTIEEVRAEVGDYRHYYMGIRGAITGGAQPPVTAAEGLAVMRLLEITERSAAERREIAFDG